MTTIGQWLAMAEARLTKAGIESSRLESQVLAAHVLLMDRSRVLAHPEESFPTFAGEALLQRRERHEPLAYILGRREFYGREFVVRPGVLIPRHETETLVEAALEAIDAVGGPVLDVGAGSGAIAVTIALERPSVEVTGVDISHAALEAAESNALLLGASVRWIRSDLFDSLPGETFGIIVSNPPYIAYSEILPTEVAGFEPGQALFAGPTGLEFYERLAQEAPPSLAAGGRLLVEMGHTQATAVRDLFEQNGWVCPRTVRDLSGVERVLELNVV